MTYRKTTEQLFDEMEERLKLLLPRDEAYNYRYQQEKNKVTDGLWAIREQLLRKDKWLDDLEFCMNQRLLSLGKILDELIIGGSKILSSGQIHRRHGFFVYALFQDDKDSPVYIGQTTAPLARLGTHTSGSKYKKDWDFFRIVQVESSEAMNILEAELIDHFKPEYNKVLPRGTVNSGISTNEFKNWRNLV